MSTLSYSGIALTTPDELLATARNLDDRALSTIHVLYFPIVYRYVSYRLEDEELIEDITSDVFVRLLDALHKNGRTILNLQAWLLGTASHLVHDHLRQKYRRNTDNLEDHENIPSTLSTETSVDHHFHQQQVRRALLELTEEQQHVLALRFSQELSLEETAQVMNKSLNAVKVMQFRALASLRRILEKRQVL